MNVLLQWALAVPADWESIDVVVSGNTAWRRLAKLALPDAGSVITQTKGWINAVNCQGILMSGYDHYAVEPVNDPQWGVGLRFSLWQDDPDDFPVGERWATVWELFDPAPDPAYGGSVNTRQRRLMYSEFDNPGKTHEWQNFTKPADAVTRHGIWMTDQLFTAHRNAESPHGWREWVK